MIKRVSFAGVSAKKKEYIVNEVNTLTSMNYLHVLRYHDYAINRQDFTVDIVMEYCSGGELLD